VADGRRRAADRDPGAAGVPDVPEGFAPGGGVTGMSWGDWLGLASLAVLLACGPTALLLVVFRGRGVA
jgi:hypothetical protein